MGKNQRGKKKGTPQKKGRGPTVIRKGRPIVQPSCGPAIRAARDRKHDQRKRKKKVPRLTAIAGQSGGSVPRYEEEGLMRCELAISAWWGLPPRIEGCTAPTPTHISWRAESFWLDDVVAGRFPRWPTLRPRPPRTSNLIIYFYYQSAVAGCPMASSGGRYE